MDQTKCVECHQKLTVTDEPSTETHDFLHVLRSSCSGLTHPSKELLHLVNQQVDPIDLELCGDCCCKVKEAVDISLENTVKEIQECEAILNQPIDPEILSDVEKMKELNAIHDQEIKVLENELKMLTNTENALRDELDKLSEAYANAENENIALAREYNRCKRTLTETYVSKATSVETTRQKSSGMVSSNWKDFDSNNSESQA